MKKNIIFYLIVSVFALSACDSSFFGPKKFSENLTGSYYNGNYIYGAAINLAWQDLNRNILGSDLVLDTKDDVALNYVENFNHSSFSQIDLDEGSYYVKSGYGQNTVNEINKKCREKFPKKSFKELSLQLSDLEIISYAYFLKTVEYPVEFAKKGNVNFMGENVSGFFSDTKEQDKNVEILKYWSDNKFIISLKLKNPEDELILAKGFELDDLEEVINQINSLDDKDIETLGSDEFFSMPNLHLDYTRDYKEIIGKFLKNKRFEKYFIGEMFENIKFDLDNKGARVENEAVVVSHLLGGVLNSKPRMFVLDKPFWVIMKKVGSSSPYFLLGVNNTNLMEKSI